MKVLILAGGYGTRLSEETNLKPKPMVEIGGKPILWHIMKNYSCHGFNEFVILLGYKGYAIKEYFVNYFLHQSDVTIDLKNNNLEVHQNNSEDWKVTLLDTGLNTMTGGRIKRAKDYIANDTFMLTYGDGLSNIDFNELLKFHDSHDGNITMSAVQPAGRYGSLEITDLNLVNGFKEKPKGDGAWINGGFFVCNPSILSYIDDDNSVFEDSAINRAILNQDIYTKKHYDFWQCMDTLRDKKYLCDLWEADKAPWKIW